MGRPKFSSMGKEQQLILRKSMSKRAYIEYCKRYRSSMTLGRNYGTRCMKSAKDVECSNHRIALEDYELWKEEMLSYFVRDFWHQTGSEASRTRLPPSRTRFTHLAHDYCAGSDSNSPQNCEKPRQIALPRLLSIWYSCARSLKVPCSKDFFNRVGCKKEEP